MINSIKIIGSILDCAKNKSDMGLFYGYMDKHRGEVMQSV